MYTGHLAVALAARRGPTRVPIVLLLLAAQGPDWIELVLTRFLTVADGQFYSHSLFPIAVGAAALSAGYALWSRDWSGAALLAGVYLTHPILDLVTSAKPLWAGGPALGACLYNRPPLDFVVECVVLLVGWWVYRGGLGSRRSSRAVWFMLVCLFACQAALDTWQVLRIYRAPAVGRGCASTATG
jgi:hypothetical protein